MSHNTTSWNSHRSTWRWTAGNDGRSPEGGKARRGGGRPPLAGQKAIGEHDQCEMPLQAIPTPALVMVQPALALGVFIKLLNWPATVGQFDQAVQRGVCRQVADVPLVVPAVAWHRALAEQPALRARADTVMAGGKLCPPGGPVHPHGHKLFAQGPVL